MSPKGFRPFALTALASLWLIGFALPAPIPGGGEVGSGTRDPRLDHWAFRGLESVEPPPVQDTRWGSTPVDRFILAALEKKGLTPAAPADRRKLIRRIHFDLIGLPPEPEEVEEFIGDSDPRAYEKLVDRLLASPQYGERWGRHWLDLARYADSNGQEGDQDRPTAYHYRDFVIRALNDDLPYDTFIRWQIAGDEIEPDDPQAIAATGFLTAGPHTVLDVPMEEEKIRNRFNELDDMIATTGSAFLGLTIGCARCHDHKFDPIPTRDYYRMLAAFTAGNRAEVPLVPREEAARWREAEKAWSERLEAARKALGAWLSAEKQPFEEHVRRARIDALPIDTGEKALLKDSPDDPRARELAKKHEKKLKGEDRDYRPLMSEAKRADWDRLAAAVKTVEAKRPPPLPTGLAMKDFGPKPRETWLLDRGDFHVKKDPVELGFLTTLTHGKAPSDYWSQAKAAGTRDDTTYQRRALADWMTDTRHGAGALLARVAVNRVWQHHFGEGLVRTVSDFGLQGELPSHPELLEYLAACFVGAGAPPGDVGPPAAKPWSLKKLHRLILLSSTYRQAPGGDAENRLLRGRRPRRIEGEVFRDAMLAVSGTLDPRMYGPAFKPPILSEAIQARNLKDPYPGDVKETSDMRRRTVYMFHKRVVQYPLMQAFDGPDAAASCGRRNVTTVAPQALAALNEPFVRLRAGEFARRLISEAGDPPAAQVERAYRLALGRAPSPRELDLSVRFLEEQAARRTARAKAPPEGKASPGEDVKLLALTDFAQVVFGLNEFLYVD